MSSTSFVNGVTLTDAGWFDDVDGIAYGSATGVAGTNTITATGPAGRSAYAAGQHTWLVPAVTNTNATTLNLTCNSIALGARNVYANGAACTGGELIAGIPVELYDDGTRFHIIGTGGLVGTSLRLTGAITVGGAVTLGDNAADVLAVNTDKMVTGATYGITLPLQSAFDAYLSVGVDNQTGDGTAYQLICNTETIDKNADYDNTTGTFTAPIAGIYLFTGSVRVRGLDALTTGITISFVTTAQTFFSDINFAANAVTVMGIAFSKVCYMTAGQTCVMKITVSGTNKTADIDGGLGGGTAFSGTLLN